MFLKSRSISVSLSKWQTCELFDNKCYKHKTSNGYKDISKDLSISEVFEILNCQKCPWTWRDQQEKSLKVVANCGKKTSNNLIHDLNEWFQHVCCTQEKDKFDVKQDKQGKMETADICLGNNLF